MSPADTVFAALLAVVLLVEGVWRLCTDAPGDGAPFWLLPLAPLFAPLAGLAMLLDTNRIAFCCSALIVLRLWAAVLRVRPDEPETDAG